jgi:nucleoside phosphorylase
MHPFLHFFPDRVMAVSWRQTLEIMLPQFQALAIRSSGLNHLFVEVSDHERDKLSGPKWIGSFDRQVKVANGEAVYGQWDWCKSHGLPSINPSFREPKPEEIFTQSDRVIRDASGTVRAVSVPMRLRNAFYCGKPSEVATAFESLANAAASALAGATDLNEHAFASDLVDIFRKPRGGVRYVLGDVPAVPKHFISSGWDAGVLQFENGVLIDMPISESTPNSDNWVLLLHRLGWRRIEGSGLRAKRMAWHDNTEVALELLENEGVYSPSGLTKLYSQVSKDSFYSVLGDKNAPLDVSLASVFAIQLLTDELSLSVTSAVTPKEAAVDYSKEEWNQRPVQALRIASKKEAKKICKPAVGILVATDVERLAVLKNMRAPKGKRALLQVYLGANTYYLGRLGALNVVVCMSSMGSIGRDSSTIVTTELIENWNPAAVIMVGIAFGKDATKQQIGNVLVADRIIPYEPQRVGPVGNQDRGGHSPAGPVLLNRCRNVIGWHFAPPKGEPCGFQVGPILSGEKLVDNVDFKRDLFERFPNAIGGEMEGAGVASAADRKRREWIVVKAICDWGDGMKTKEHQSFAAASSVHFVEHILNQLGALDELSK